MTLSGSILSVEVWEALTHGFPPIVSRLSSATVDTPLTSIDSMSPCLTEEGKRDTI